MEKKPIFLSLLIKRIGSKKAKIIVWYSYGWPHSLSFNVLHTIKSASAPKNNIYAIKKKPLVVINNIATKDLDHSPNKIAERSHISIIYTFLNLFLAFKRMYTENIFAAITYINPTIEP
jgi:hypothetical protein